MNWEEASLLILTSDERLMATLGAKLQGWGVHVHQFDLWRSSSLPGNIIDVVLVDIRTHTEDALQWLNSIRKEIPLVETVLINSSANISASMAGMRAGASEELIVPFDTETLRKTISAACDRSKTRQKKKKRRPLFAVFGEAMSAATFAQAGEYETALDILNGGATRKGQDSTNGKKNNPKR